MKCIFGNDLLIIVSVEVDKGDLMDKP
ncbi:hypothetical protein F383_33877 [Gossypium arboreum]|uniref:Uncharacterized protein n=1 Tax=Gossypium arboreum TaxID=29729 RepID=A0A0B0PP99_GOSAR|nr:hypothetical protein F383_33877 [Gossypium arboreum]